jgi:BirA family biotin operon repressor/biotin-[acetyl-CoA-carboxylase] ligase
MDADQIRDLVFGLGLNLNSAGDAWPGPLNRRAISLAEHTQAPLDINKFSAALIGRVLDAYEQFLSGTYVKTFATRWHEYDLLRGKTIKLLHGTETIAGTAAGIDDEGSLILKTERGRTERFRAGEVTIEKK